MVVGTSEALLGNKYTNRVYRVHFFHIRTVSHVFTMTVYSNTTLNSNCVVGLFYLFIF